MHSVVKVSLHLRSVDVRCRNLRLFQCDDFPVTEKVALQLAGLQAQVALGDPREKSKLEYYTNIDTYLPYRISRTRGDDVWVSFFFCLLKNC